MKGATITLDFTGNNEDYVDFVEMLEQSEYAVVVQETREFP